MRRQLVRAFLGLVMIVAATTTTASAASGPPINGTAGADALFGTKAGE